MSYKKLRTTVTKKRFVITLYNGNRVRRLRIRAHNEDEVQEIASQKCPEWNTIMVAQRF